MRRYTMAVVVALADGFLGCASKEKTGMKIYVQQKLYDKAIAQGTAALAQNEKYIAYPMDANPGGEGHWAFANPTPALPGSPGIPLSSTSWSASTAPSTSTSTPTSGSSTTTRSLHWPRPIPSVSCWARCWRRRALGRLGKKFGLLFGTTSWAAWQIIPIVAHLMGWLPENGDALLVPILIAIRIVQGASTVQANVAFGSMVADTIDEHELNTGKRQEGIFFASSSFSAKAASGMGNIIAGFALDLINWPRGQHIRTAADVPAEAMK